ncbi:MAG: type IV secretory system conjugative DNA transfer family protein, partial [Blastocatellia bacterium]
MHKSTTRALLLAVSIGCFSCFLSLSSTAQPSRPIQRQRAATPQPQSSVRGQRPAKTATAQDHAAFTKGPWFIVLIAALLLAAYKFSRKLLPSTESHTTTGRLADDKEVLDNYQLEWGRGGYLLGRLASNQSGSPLSRMLLRALCRSGPATALRLPPERRLSHIMIQAGPGAGKTTANIIPQLIEDAHSGLFNAYVIDRKAPELYQMVCKVWNDKDHRVIYFDPWRPQLTYGFEPLLHATEPDIESIVQVFIEVSADPNSITRHYRDQERQILRKLLRAAQAWGKCRGETPNLHCRCPLGYEEHVVNRAVNSHWDCGCRCRRHFCSLPSVADLLTKGWRATHAAIRTARPDLNEELTDVWELRNNELAGLFAGLAAKLELFRQPGPRAAFSRNDFSFADIVPPVSAGTQIQRTLLIVGAPQSKQDHSVLLASLMTQFLAQEIYLRRDEMAAQGCRWTDVVPVSVCLDEFGTYPVSHIDDFIATARSGAAGVLAAVQSQDQLAQYYGAFGRAAVPAMLTNFRTKIYLSGCDSRVAAELSERTGTKLVTD